MPVVVPALRRTRSGGDQQLGRDRCGHVRFMQQGHSGCVATFKKRQESDGSGRAGAVSCNHPEQLVDELNLSPTIQTAHPPRLPLPDHVHGLVALDRSPRRVECTKALLRLHASFDRSMILLHDVVQVLDRSVAATAWQDSCLFHPRNCRAVETGLISVDDAGLRMRRISQRLGGCLRHSLLIRQPICVRAATRTMTARLGSCACAGRQREHVRPPHGMRRERPAP